MRRNPNVIDIDPSRYVAEMAEQHGVELGRDGSAIFKYLANVTDSYEQGLSVTKNDPEYIEHDGAKYVLTEYGYTSKVQLEGNRMLAAIRPGNRTELAYWTAAASPQVLTIHRGIGILAIGSPSKSEVELIQLNAEVETEVTIPNRSFYCLEAARRVRGLLIVSELYVPPVSDWEKLEIGVLPGQEYINLQTEGMIRVPDGFRERYEG